MLVVFRSVKVVRSARTKGGAGAARGALTIRAIDWWIDAAAALCEPRRVCLVDVTDLWASTLLRKLVMNDLLGRGTKKILF